MLVNALDKAGIQVNSALWLFTEEDRGWQLVIASSDVERFGSRSFYGKIANIVSEHSPLALSYVSARKPTDYIVSLLRQVASTGPGVSGFRFTGNVVNGIPIPDAYIYRLS